MGIFIFFLFIKLNQELESFTRSSPLSMTENFHRKLRHEKNRGTPPIKLHGYQTRVFHDQAVSLVVTKTIPQLKSITSRIFASNCTLFICLFDLFVFIYLVIYRGWGGETEDYRSDGYEFSRPEENYIPDSSIKSRLWRGGTQTSQTAGQARPGGRAM